MLVLSRRPDEKILLPTVPAFIKVLSAQTNLVRLGVEAPASVPVLRDELTRTDRPRRPAGRGHGSPSLGNLFLALTGLRLQLTPADPGVQETLDRMEDELESLRAALELHPVVVG